MTDAMAPASVAVLLAGGRGERFWPRSRADLPKQFLTIVGDETLLQATYARARRVVGDGPVYVVTQAPLAARVRQQLPDLEPACILVEPAGRDTAAALAFAMAVVAAREPGRVAMALPADHLILDVEAFVEAAHTALAHAGESGRLVLLGMRPTRPETAYGYILPAAQEAGRPWARVARFVEKPSADDALRLIAGGEALWNSGMFFWRPEAYLAAVERHLPAVASAATALAHTPDDAAARAAYCALEPISVDYGVLERDEDVSVVPARFLWDDVGNWGALSRLASADGAGNVVRGRGLAIDSRRVTIDAAAGRLVVAFGLEGVVVVDSGDAVLVAASERAADMKRVTQALRGQGLGEYLERSGDRLPVREGTRVVEKPWGRELWWAETDRYLAKVLELEPGHALSLQYHHDKHETMLVLCGTGSLLVDERPIALSPGLSVDIPPGTVHRLAAGDETLVVVEVSTAHPGDVVRLEDRYGRVDATARAGGEGA